MENRLKKYEPYFSTGLWHVHTTYTDGKNTVEDYCRLAQEKKIPLIAFTEHVRRKLDYHFEDFVNDIQLARKKYPHLILLIGCETKVLDLAGNLDVSEEVKKMCDVIMGVFHSFPHSDKVNYLHALKNMLQRKEINVWGHPTLFCQKRNFTLSPIDIEEVVDLCKKYNIYIEHNLRYNLPNELFLNLARKAQVPIICGMDLHDASKL